MQNGSKYISECSVSVFAFLSHWALTVLKYNWNSKNASIKENEEHIICTCFVHKTYNIYTCHEVRESANQKGLSATPSDGFDGKTECVVYMEMRPSKQIYNINIIWPIWSLHLWYEMRFCDFCWRTVGTSAQYAVCTYDRLEGPKWLQQNSYVYNESICWFDICLQTCYIFGKYWIRDIEQKFDWTEELPFKQTHM